MAKYFFSFIAVFLLLVDVDAQVKISPPPNAANYIRISEDDHDFGSIEYGHSVSYLLGVKICSKDSIYLSNVEASCGCTTPEWKRKWYQPNDTFSIRVAFNGYVEGLFNKTLSLVLNDSIVKIVRFHGVGVISKNPVSVDDEDASMTAQVHMRTPILFPFKRVD